jgi:hypothetical protein
MSNVLDWDNVVGGDNKGPASMNTGGGGIFLKLRPGKTYRVRPVAKPVEVWKYFSNKNGKNRSAITADPENCPIRTKYNLEPKLKYAINVFDREDGKLRVMEAPISVLKVMKEWYIQTKLNPGGKDGGDFSIKVELPSNGDKKNTKYTTTFLMQVPFTAEEKKYIDEKGLHKLAELFKPDDAATIEKKLFGDEETPATSGGQTPTVQTQGVSKDADLNW